MTTTEQFIKKGEQWEELMDAQRFISPLCRCINQAAFAYSKVKKYDKAEGIKRLSSLAQKALDNVRTTRFVDARCQGYEAVYNVAEFLQDDEITGIIAMEIADDAEKAPFIVPAIRMYQSALKFASHSEEARNYVTDAISLMALSNPNHSERLLRLI